MSEALPLDEERRFELTLDVNFWARALNRPSLRSLQHLDHDEWRSRVVGLVQTVLDRHPEAAEVDAGDTADILVAFVDGVGLHGLIYPEHMTAERIQTLLHSQVRALLVLNAD